MHTLGAHALCVADMLVLAPPQLNAAQQLCSHREVVMLEFAANLPAELNQETSSSLITSGSALMLLVTCQIHT